MFYKSLSFSIFILIVSFLFTSSFHHAQETFLTVKLDTVRAQKFDTGKMWTFEDAPLDYFESVYGFKPDQNWLNHVRLSTLKFATWCTSSFVSEDGLIMTNHHCIDFVTSRIEEEGENIAKQGFYANTLSDERKIPGVFVEQTIIAVDVTEQIINTINSIKDKGEKIKKKKEKIDELVAGYSEDTGLTCRVTSLYNGGKYTLYGYKKFDDIRAVYINESEMGLYGGDPDNFTYPRYNPDFAFLRVYDSTGNPLKTENYLKWSKNGPQENEPIFVVGNPGSTERLNTIAQLEYKRDITYKNAAFILEGTVDLMYEIMEEFPERTSEITDRIILVANSAKAFSGIYNGLVDPVFIARKKDFEIKFKEVVFSKENLKEKYGHIWNGIETTRMELRNIGHQLAAYNTLGNRSSVYFRIANDIVKLAEQLQIDIEERDSEYTENQLKETIDGIFPQNIDKPMEFKKLKLQLEFIKMNLGDDDLLVNKLFNGQNSQDATRAIIENSVTSNKDLIYKIISEGPIAILGSNDPLIYFVVNTKEKLTEYRSLQNEILQTEEVLEDELGRALFEVYGTSIPPDATFTLRISDGVMAQYNYNGTIAPVITTFYGLYDRYYSHKKKYPWNLPERWLNPKEGFNLSTPFNFITTNDITGGSSGSPVINKKAEIIGIAFDGNIESLPGNFIYSTEKNRCVNVTSQGILAVLRYIGDAERIAAELELGMIPNKYR